MGSINLPHIGSLICAHQGRVFDGSLLKEELSDEF